MASNFEKYQRRRLISSYFSVVLSIALVLFLLGILGLVVLNSKKVADHFKEQVAITVYLKDSAKEVEIKQLQKSLALADHTKATNYTTKEEAAQEYSEEIGEDFMEYIGENPLKNSIDVYLKADFVTSEEVQEIVSEIEAKGFVEEVVYDQPLIDLLNDNIKKISLWILIISGLFTFIAVLLINSSIRLSVYSKRFTIKTMQMVGATKSFIRRPFIWKSMQLGMLGAVIALLGMGGVLYYMDDTFPELQLLSDPQLLIALFAIIFLASIVITWFSTFLATQRFLNLKTDELYY